MKAPSLGCPMRIGWLSLMASGGTNDPSTQMIASSLETISFSAATALA
jgi:hypothetical protein